MLARSERERPNEGEPGSGPGLECVPKSTRLDVTPAAVSQHAKVLRDANLITSSRSGPAVRHALTPLGRAMLYE